MTPHTTPPPADAPLPWLSGLALPLALNLLVALLMLWGDTGFSLDIFSDPGAALPTGLTGLCVMTLAMLVATAWQQREGGDYSARMEHASHALLLLIALVSALPALSAMVCFASWCLRGEDIAPALIATAELGALWTSVALALPLWRGVNDQLRAHTVQLATSSAQLPCSPRTIARLIAPLILPIALGSALLCMLPCTLAITLANKTLNSNPCGTSSSLFRQTYTRCCHPIQEATSNIVIGAHGN